HMLFAQLTESLDEKAAQPPGSCHVSRRRLAKLDYRRTDLHRPGWAIREEYRLRRHLLGEPQGVGRIGTGWLQARLVPASKRPGHCLSRWRKWPENRVLFGEVVHAAGKPANGFVPGKAV